MTRYEVHSMIAGMDIGEQMDLEVCKSLIEKYGSSRDIELLITDNGIDMTYGEVADQLNRYHKREEILRKSDSVNDLTLSVLDLQEELKELKQENKELKQFKQKIFDLINGKIAECEKDYNRAIQAGMPSMIIYDEIESLEWLKKELEE